MPRAKVVTNSGAVVTIAGSPEEIALILARLEGGAPLDATRTRRLLPGHTASNEQRPTGPSSLILALKTEGFFDQPKTLSSIALAIEERGFLYPTTTLSGTVLALLKRGQLHRKKVEGRWVYGR